MGRCSIYRPCIVVDTNWIRQQGDNSLQFPAGVDLVISDPMLSEFSDACAAGKRRDGLMLKLLRFFRANHGRVFIGRFPSMVISFETRPGKLASQDFIIDRRASRSFEGAAAMTEAEWLTRIQQPIVNPYASPKDSFRQFCEEWAQLAREKSSELANKASNPTGPWLQHLRSPAAILPLAKWHDSRFGLTPWQDALNVFPDRHAIGRVCRLRFWYMISTLGGTRDPKGNNWEDSCVAFLASYTGWLATSDSALKKLIRDIFPDVKIWGA